MALMIFINAVKLFHTHHESAKAFFSSGASYLAVKSHFPPVQVSQDNHCPICDFNLMKDADMGHSVIVFFARMSSKALFTSQLPQSFHHFAIPGKDRAPPSLLS
jgi:hypothetical protein